MRTFSFIVGLLVICLLLIFSGEKYPVESIAKSQQSFSKTAIRDYVGSVDKQLKDASKQASLVYSLNNYSFQVLKYSLNGKPILYIEKTVDGETGKSEKRYYLKDNKLAYYTEELKPGNFARPYISTKAYFRNNALFYAEQRSALSDSSLKEVGFQETDLSKKDQFSDLALLEDALNQKGPFNLVFNGIADYPKAKYIILSGSNYNSYRAPIRVDSEDEFVHELSTNAYHYRGEKLEIDYLSNDTNEIVYKSGKLSKN